MGNLLLQLQPLLLVLSLNWDPDSSDLDTSACSEPNGDPDSSDLDTSACSEPNRDPDSPPPPTPPFLSLPLFTLENSLNSRFHYLTLLVHSLFH